MIKNHRQGDAELLDSLEMRRLTLRLYMLQVVVVTQA